MSKFKLWVGIVLVLIVGLLAGAVGMGMYIRHKLERTALDDSKRGRPPMMGMLLNKLEKDLDLTKEQKHEIENVMIQSFEYIHFIMREHPELDTMSLANMERIKAILSAEQKEKMGKLRIFKKVKNRFPPMPHFREHAPHERLERELTKLKEGLQFTDTQEKEVKPIIEESLERRRKILQNHGMDARHRRLAMKNELQELQENVDKQLKKILTQKQMAAYREIQAEKWFMREDMKFLKHP